MESQLGKVGIAPDDNLGAQFHDGLGLFKHVARNQMPGTITNIVWKVEETTVLHEYILVSVVSGDGRRLSFMRLERLGADHDDKDPSHADHARFPVTLADSENLLSNTKDRTLQRAALTPSPKLVDLAQLTLFLHETVPTYSLLSHNCWWLARELFRSLITHFTPHSKVKVDLLFYCVKREWEQCEASYHSSGRGRVLRGIALVATMPIFPVAWPIIIGGSLITAVTVKVALRRSRKDLDEQVNQYLTGGK